MLARFGFALLCAVLRGGAKGESDVLLPLGFGRTLYSFGFAPRPIVLAAGRPVTLVFVNRSGSSHDFVARSFFATSRIVGGDAMQGMVDLRGGETKTVRLVPRAGVYRVHCSHFMHSVFGMTDRIIVN